MLDIGGMGPPGGGPLIGPYMGTPGPMGPPGPIGPPGPLGGVIRGPIPGGPEKVESKKFSSLPMVPTLHWEEVPVVPVERFTTRTHDGHPHAWGHYR